MSHTRSKFGILDANGLCIYEEILGASRYDRLSSTYRLYLSRGGKSAPGSGSREVEERSIFIQPCLGNPIADYPALFEQIIMENPITDCFRTVKIIHPITAEEFGPFKMSCKAANIIEFQFNFVPNSFDGIGGTLNVPDTEVVEIVRKGTAVFQFIKDELFVTWKIISDLQFLNANSTYIRNGIIKMTVFDRTDPERISETFEFDWKIENPVQTTIRMELESGTLPAIVDPEIKLEIFVTDPISSQRQLYETQSFIPSIIKDFPPGEGPPEPEPTPTPEPIPDPEPEPIPDPVPGPEPLPEPEPEEPPIVVTPKTKTLRNVGIAAAGLVIAALVVRR